ncbi:hypothetical protein GJ904_23065 [Salmonella enterica]|nr:hypothetical protein [Salmonella enterica subsp. enterica serovar Saintpaul]EEC1303942.1 hypothetical protein [Salmonella enterica]
MTVTTNGQGVATGKFTIPKGIKAGTKQVMFRGANNSPSYAETTFTGQGTVVTNTMRQVQNVMQAYYDPLAQTFMLTEARQLHAVDIWVMGSGNTPLIVQLRETQTGFPTRVVLAEGRVSQPIAGLASGGQWVKIPFDVPFYASANVEYAVVVLANDAITEVGISELGKVDKATNNYVTTQPYQVGVLLSSANASTWTAHQDRDLTFRLYARKYNAGAIKSVPLGTVTLPAGTTDLLISALTTTPATGADAEIQLTQTVGGVKTTRTVSDGQVIKFKQVQSGDLEVTAILRCTNTASATIAPGTQIIAGVMGDTGTYITRDIDADANHPVDISVTMEGLNASVVRVDYAVSDHTTPITSSSWKSIPETTPNPPTTLANGRQELTFKIEQVPAMSFFKARITLKGQPDQRPEIFNLRVSVVEHK